jgi:hypothetical protein
MFVSKDYILSICNEALTDTEQFIDNCDSTQVESLQYAMRMHSVINQLIQIL